MNSNFIVRLLRLTIPIFILGVLFKIMHWPYASFLILISVVLLVLLYPIRFYLKKEKRVIDYSKLFLLIAFPISYYLKVFHYPTPLFLTIISLVSFYSWILLEFIDLYNKHENKNDSFKVFPFKIQSLLFIIILVGVIFRIFHFPNSTPILITGFLLLFLYFLIDTFKPKK